MVSQIFFRGETNENQLCDVAYGDMDTREN